MIRIALRRKASGDLIGFDVSGHAGYAPHGEDIVCAAVSALAQTTVLGLERFGADFQLDETGGRIAIQLNESDGTVDREMDALVQRSRDILETTALGFRAIADSYGKFVQLSDSREEGQS